jgi:hypothetical protein
MGMIERWRKAWAVAEKTPVVGSAGTLIEVMISKTRTTSVSCGKKQEGVEIVRSEG